MKPLPFAFLTVSLALNAALAYAALSGRARLADTTSAFAPNSGLSTLNPQLSTPVSSPSPVDPATWSKLDTTDLPTLVTRLREAGFPQDVIRTMLSALVREQFAARRRALDPDADQRGFWKNRAPDQRLALAQFRLGTEEQDALRALLGPDARDTSPAALAYERSRLGDLPPDRLAAARLILTDYDRRRSELHFTKGTYTLADLAPLERELRTSLAAVLTPAQLEEYDFRASMTGSSLRGDLASFDPTEAEFRAIFKLRQPFDEKFSFISGILSQDQIRERSAAQKEVTAQITALLGPERGADYERSTDYNFRQTSQLVARLELPPSTAVALWATQKEIEQRRNDLSRAGAATPAERTAQLTALRDEAIAKITPLLGSASRVEAYKQYGGFWLAYLVPQPPPPK